MMLNNVINNAVLTISLNKHLIIRKLYLYTLLLYLRVKYII